MNTSLPAILIAIGFITGWKYLESTTTFSLKERARKEVREWLKEIQKCT